MKYQIDIQSNDNDTFENNADNVGMVEIYDANGVDITSKASVNIYLSRNALLGFGTELIRLAHRYKETKHVHIEPAEVDMLVQRMGIFLRPDSAKMSIVCSDSELIDNYFQNRG